jgi:hypothetical protein
LVTWADRDRQIQAAVQDIDILPKLATLEDVVRLEPDRLVLVLGPDETGSEAQDGRDYGEARWKHGIPAIHDDPLSEGRVVFSRRW